MNALRQHQARVIGVVDGLAASAASFIAVGGCDELVMAEHSELMIHDAWGLCLGNAEDMTTMAADLDRISDNIASIYARKAGGSAQDWREVMRAEKFYSADDAVDAGLADRVDRQDEESDPAEESAGNRWDRSIFASSRPGSRTFDAGTDLPTGAWPRPATPRGVQSPSSSPRPRPRPGPPLRPPRRPGTPPHRKELTWSSTTRSCPPCGRASVSPTTPTVT